MRLRRPNEPDTNSRPSVHTTTTLARPCLPVWDCFEFFVCVFFFARLCGPTLISPKHTHTHTSAYTETSVCTCRTCCECLINAFDPPNRLSHRSRKHCTAHDARSHRHNGVRHPGHSADTRLPVQHRRRAGQSGARRLLQVCHSAQRRGHKFRAKHGRLLT